MPKTKAVAAKPKKTKKVAAPVEAAPSEETVATPEPTETKVRPPFVPKKDNGGVKGGVV